MVAHFFLLLSENKQKKTLRFDMMKNGISLTTMGTTVITRKKCRVHKNWYRSMFVRTKWGEEKSMKKYSKRKQLYQVTQRERHAGEEKKTDTHTQNWTKHSLVSFSLTKLFHLHDYKIGRTIHWCCFGIFKLTESDTNSAETDMRKNSPYKHLLLLKHRERDTLKIPI